LYNFLGCGKGFGQEVCYERLTTDSRPLFLTVGVSTVIFVFFASYAEIRNGSSLPNLVSDADTIAAAMPRGTALAEKCARPGVLNYFNFDSPSHLHYTWSVTNVLEEVLIHGASAN